MNLLNNPDQIATQTYTIYNTSSGKTVNIKEDLDSTINELLSTIGKVINQNNKVGTKRSQVV